MREPTVVNTNKAFYRVCARDYDKGREDFYRMERRRIDRELLQFYRGSGSPWTALDVGCGTGLFALAAARAGATTMHCLDIEAEFLHTTAARLATEHPSIEVVEHEIDFGTLVRDRAEICKEVDLVVLGAVVQYIPDCEEVLRSFIKAAPRARFLISSTRWPNLGCRWLENGMIVADYSLHRFFRRAKKRKDLPDSKISLSVDPLALEQMFQACGMRTCLRRYTSFHTSLFNNAHRLLMPLLPGLGTYFTLAATPAYEAGGQ